MGRGRQNNFYGGQPMKHENNKEGSIVENLLISLQTTINEVGLLNTITILENGKAGKIEKSDIHLVSEAVCVSFDIPQSTLLTRAKLYPRKYAFNIWVYLCVEKLKYTPSDLSQFTKRSKGTIYKAQSWMKKLIKNSDNPFNAKILQKLKDSEYNLTNLLNNR